MLVRVQHLLYFFRLTDLKMEHKDYSKEFSHKSFWQKVKKYAKIAGKEVVEKTMILYFVLKDKETSVKCKAIIIGALGYFILPADAIPDVTPLIGFTDDLGVIVYALGAISDCIKPRHKSGANQKVKEWFDDHKDISEDDDIIDVEIIEE